MVPSNSSRSRSRFWCCDALLCGADDANVVIVVVVVVVVPGVLLSRATTPSTMLFVGCRRLIVMGTEGNTRPKAGTHRCDDDVNDDDMTLSRRSIDDDDDNANDDDVNDDGVVSLGGGGGGVKALVLRVR